MTRNFRMTRTVTEQTIALLPRKNERKLSDNIFKIARILYTPSRLVVTERKKKCRNMSNCKSVRYCFPSLFSPVSVRCILSLACIPVVLGLLMHYSVLYFAFCATWRIRESNARYSENFNKWVAKLVQSNLLVSNLLVLLIYLLLHFILPYLALAAFWKKNILRNFTTMHISLVWNIVTMCNMQLSRDTIVSHAKFSAEARHPIYLYVNWTIESQIISITTERIEFILGLINRSRILFSLGARVFSID